MPEEEAKLVNCQETPERPIILFFFFPGPLLLWDWKDGVREKAKDVKELADLTGARIIPMPIIGPNTR